MPQFSLESDVDVQELVSLRLSIPADISLSDFVTAAVARSLVEYPELNASFDGDAILVHEAVNVGLAFALDDGLVVACIHDADRRSLAELATERARLGEAARAGQLTPSELLDATFTISNLGPFGIHRFRALIVPPQAAILAVGALAAERLTVTLSCDHRAVDGAPAARFLRSVVERLQQPATLLTA